ncbi:MAG: methyltransferase regulatory domain-containing protein [Anaerolineae bacterium]
MSQTASPTSYDDVPYPILCYTQTHPDRLATCARLLGLEPAPVERCRVVELGCASGGNLIPMAATLPESTFVGIDLSARQITEASATVAALGLKNAAFFAIDIRDVTPSLGTFDYVIAHGVYSWVPPEVRDRLLEVCSANLAPNGVAYVSYNAYPGWHMLQGLREMMLYHIRHETDGHQRAEKARELVALLARSVADERNHAYGTFIDSYRDLLDKQVQDGRPHVDSVILHDELAEWNDPVYFSQFAAHAGSHGLQFLVEADFPMSMPNNLSSDTFQALQDICESIVDTEQYMDFVRNRAFRRTLLCHEDLAIDRTLRSGRVHELAIATRAQRLPPKDGDAGVVRYASPDGATFQTDDDVTSAALDYLAEIAPQAVPFAGLVDVAAGRVAPRELTAADTSRLAANLLKAFTYSVSLIELHAWIPPFVSTLTERPTASPCARYQARQSDRVANLRHERVHVDPLARYLLPLLDGTRTRDDLAAVLDDLVARGALKIPHEGHEDDSPSAVLERVHRELDNSLAWLARTSLLVG